MNVLGLIAEYNPFHLGHRYHLKKSKQVTGSNYSVAVMSGSFVQRGEPSFVDKWTKAKMAIDNGVDLVIELPFMFSIQSAESFAFGAIKLLHSLNIINYVAFGNEEAEMDILEHIAQILVKEPDCFKQYLRKYLNMGYSFPVARSYALKRFSERCISKMEDFRNVENILKMPNNILAIEYLKSLKRLNSDIRPVSIQRIGSNYGDIELDGAIASATGIRNSILKDGIDSIEKHVPSATYRHLIDYISKYQQFNSLDNYDQIIHYILNTIDKNILIDMIDMEPGLENRFIEQSSRYKDINHLIQAISTRRYPRTRIQRILVHLMAKLTKSIFDELSVHHPLYIRVLGANNNGFLILNRIKENSTVPIITKFANYRNYNNMYLNKMISMDKISTDLYFMGLNTTKPYIGMDYYTTPYILTK
ncbi:MAG: nucleotidyltransferase [Tissierellia bacterium]|nr:nucleotidyltransferase [Tissierellia bacterium]